MEQTVECTSLDKDYPLSRQEVYHELTLYMDLWNNEIVSHALSARRGDRMTYISGLHDLLELKKLLPDHELILHSDRGSVYSA